MVLPVVEWEELSIRWCLCLWTGCNFLMTSKEMIKGSLFLQFLPFWHIIAFLVKWPSFLFQFEHTIGGIQQLHGRNFANFWQYSGTPNIRDWVLHKRDLDGDNSSLKFIIFFSKYQKKIFKLYFMHFFSADAKGLSG